MPRRITSLPTSIYTKRPNLGLPQQIAEFLQKHGASTAAEIRFGVSKNKEAARFIVTEVNTSCHQMARRGVLSRERRRLNSYWSLVEEKQACGKPRTKGGARIAVSLAPKFAELVRDVDPEIRSLVLSQMYIAACSGRYKRTQVAALRADAVKAVRKKIRGGWREWISLDAPLTEDGGTLMDVLSDDDAYLPSRLWIVESRVDEIMRMLADGFTEQQIAPLWNTSVSSWMTGRAA